jgi:20S proteasome alpha/beta subunit
MRSRLYKRCGFLFCMRQSVCSSQVSHPVSAHHHMRSALHAHSGRWDQGMAALIIPAVRAGNDRSSALDLLPSLTPCSCQHLWAPCTGRISARQRRRRVTTHKRRLIRPSRGLWLQGAMSLGIKATNGVVLATEKKLPSTLIDEATVRKINDLTDSVGVVYSGMGPDNRVLLKKARKAAETYRRQYNEPIPVAQLVREVAATMQEFTRARPTSYERRRAHRRCSGACAQGGTVRTGVLRAPHLRPCATRRTDAPRHSNPARGGSPRAPVWRRADARGLRRWQLTVHGCPLCAEGAGVRPFGVALMLAGYDDGGPQLYQIDPSGTFFAWKASAIGKNAVNAKTFLEKRCGRAPAPVPAPGLRDVLLIVRVAILNNSAGMQVDSSRAASACALRAGTRRTSRSRTQCTRRC